MSHDEELRWVKRRKGTRRSGSRETPGYDRDLLREDTGHLLGPTESRPANIDEIIQEHAPALPPHPTVAQQFAGRAVNEIMDALRPHIMQYVDVAVDNKLGVPKLVKWVKNKAEQRRGELRNQNPSASARLKAVHGEATSAIGDETDTLGVQIPSVTAEQYQAALRAALQAEQYAAQVRQLLAQVAVRDYAESATQPALDTSASSIDEATPRRAVEQLDSRSTVDVEFMPVKDYDTLPAVDERPS